MHSVGWASLGPAAPMRAALGLRLTGTGQHAFVISATACSCPMKMKREHIAIPSARAPSLRNVPFHRPLIRKH
jgi:hypothetical protein